MDLKNTRNACVVMCVMLTGTAGQLNAQTGSAGQGGEFLRYGVGARALAMGRAFTALANDASAVYWNPAGLGTLNQWQLAAMHSRLFADSRYQYLAVAGPLFSSNNSRLTHHFGAGLINLTSDNFDQRNSFNVSTGTFGTQDFAVLLPYALNIVNSWGSFNLGVKPQFFSQEVQNTSGSGFGVDIGFLWQPLSPPALGFIPLKSLMAWRLGVNYRALSSVKLLTLEQDYPNSLNIGISNVAFEDVLDGIVPGEWISRLPVKMAVSYEFEKIFQSVRESEHHLGAELTTRLARSLVVAARYGYRFGRASVESRSSFGFGFKTDGALWQNAPLLRGLDVDFANADHPQLGNTYQLFLTARLGDWRRNVKMNRGRFKGLSDAALLGFLSQYSEDDRVIGERDSIDTVYKDEVAWELSDRSGDSPFLRRRYDEFIRGLPLLLKFTNREFQRIKDYHANVEFVSPHGRPENTGWPDWPECGVRVHTLDSLRKAYESFRPDLLKEGNETYLFNYTRAVLLLGGQVNNQKVIEILKERRTRGMSPAETLEARTQRVLASKSGIDKLLQETTDDTLRLLLDLTRAVALVGQGGTDNSSFLKRTRSSPVNLIRSLRSRHLTTPFIADGVLDDDVRFVDLCARAEAMSALDIRYGLLEVMLRLPHTDIGKALQKKRRDIWQLGKRSDVEARSELISLFWLPYQTRFLANLPIGQNVFETVVERGPKTTRN